MSQIPPGLDSHGKDGDVISGARGRPQSVPNRLKEVRTCSRPLSCKGQSGDSNPSPSDCSVSSLHRDNIALVHFHVATFCLFVFSEISRPSLIQILCFDLF